MRITYGKSSRKEEKRRKQNYVGEKRQEASAKCDQDLNIVIENARNLATCIGMDVKTFTRTFANLKIIDVIKSEHKKKIKVDNIIQPDWIVAQTPSYTYKSGIVTVPVTLSETAKEIIARELEFLRSIGEHISRFSHNNCIELFPGTFNPPRQILSDKELEELAQKPPRKLSSSERKSIERWKIRKIINQKQKPIPLLEETRVRRLKKIMHPQYGAIKKH